MLPPFVSPETLPEHAVLVQVLRTPEGTGIELDRWLAGLATPQDGRHPLPTASRFAEGLSQAGIGDGDAVVAFDDAQGVVAARLVWMLRALGEDAALLDGPPPRPPSVRAPAVFTPRPWPRRLFAEADDLADPGLVLLDARPRERYLGAPDPLDPAPGHVPGARSLPCRDNVGPDGRLLSVGVLRERLLAVGVTGGTDVVSSCGSGVTACHTLLVAEHVGLGTGRLYAGSWSQWASDPSRPREL